MKLFFIIFCLFQIDFSFFFPFRLPVHPFGHSTRKSTNDPAQVISIMKSTNFCEILSLLYGVLVAETDNNNNNQAISENNNITPLHDKTFIIVNNGLLVLNTIAILDLDTFQVGK